MTSVSEGVIAGAGIAGLSAGITLARVGVSTTVVELDPAVVDQATGLTISAVGMRAIRDLGLADAVTARGAGSSDTIVGDAAGRELDRVVYPPMAGSELPAAGGIMRSDFHRLLLRTAEQEGA